MAVKKAVRTVLGSLGYEVRRKPGFSRPEPDLILPKIKLGSVIDGKTDLRIAEAMAEPGNVSLCELLVIATLVRRRSPRVLFEIGTFDGRTTLNMIVNAPDGAKLFTLDLPGSELDRTKLNLETADRGFITKPFSGRRFRDTPHASQIVQLFGDSATFDFSPYYGQADVVFVDGSHSYDYVANDTEVAMKLIGDAGLIIWHDYQPFWTGVVRKLEELFRLGGKYTNLKSIEGTALVILEC